MARCTYLMAGRVRLMARCTHLMAGRIHLMARCTHLTAGRFRLVAGRVARLVLSEGGGGGGMNSRRGLHSLCSGYLGFLVFTYCKVCFGQKCRLYVHKVGLENHISFQSCARVS